MQMRGTTNGDGDGGWGKRRLQDLAWSGVLTGPGYLYRPGQVLGRVADADVLEPVLPDCDDPSRDSRNEMLGALGLRLWSVDPAIDLLALVSRLRAAGPKDEPPLRVGVNTVFAGEPRYIGGPGGPPRRSGELTVPDLAGLPARWPGVRGGRPALSVLDTGWALDVDERHPALAALEQNDPDDIDRLDVDGRDGLDTEAGHGTFVCGLVQRLRPGLLLDNQGVLDPVGWGDDVSVAIGLMQADAPVLNLSFGGYSEDDRPPIALEAALRRLGRDSVVVAAAGNNGSERPFWPAASKHVIAVAALDTTQGDPREAPFSNRGTWVDACAPGVHLQSTYVRGWQDAGAGLQEFEGWACWDGTSFAAPLVAAAIAADVAAGATPRAAAAALLGGLAPLPGLADFGVWYDPGIDLLCHEH